MKKKIAHCIHHTHWDPFWYFTPQDERVVASYNMKEMFKAFENEEIKDFFFDGQTVGIDLYLEAHPEDTEKIRALVETKKLIIGPFISQLDCYITSGESVINNLRLGMANADKLGGTSHIAYLPDSFGHNIDFPKVFNQFDIHDFVFTRGMGDEYGMGNEFYFESNDGSKVLAHTLLSGYGYGAYAFMEGTLFSDDAVDYNRISVNKLIDRLIDNSTLDNEFVFPLGFDQNPIMLGIEEKIEYYNKKFPEFEFKYTNWVDFFENVRSNGEDIKTLKNEIMSGQHHRIHKSGMHSARADIKNLQDETERILIYEVQPLMSMLDSLGIEYESGMLDKAWYTLANCQTHASATHPDNTNSWIKENTLVALNIAKGLKQHLVRLAAIGVENQNKEDITNLVVFNTLPFEESKIAELKIFTRKRNFDLVISGKKLDYTIISCEEGFDGVVRTDTDLMNKNEYFYETKVVVDLGFFKGISYKTIEVIESDNVCKAGASYQAGGEIENTQYKVTVSHEGIRVRDKINDITIENALYFEDVADYGDSYDYSEPYNSKDEWTILNEFDDHNLIVDSINSNLTNTLNIKGILPLPKDLQSRRGRKMDCNNPFQVKITIREGSDIIEVNGSVDNKAINHRLRLVVKTNLKNEMSYAGTQFGYTTRSTTPLFQDDWKERGYFEKPTGTFPLLNHVSAVGGNTVTIFTKGIKEYEFIGSDNEDIALTLFRSHGHFGLPDLKQRPGRPSGLSSKVLTSSDSLMLIDNHFNFGIKIGKEFDGNSTANSYVRFATNISYYQNQVYNKLTFPTSFFPMNPPKIVLPKNYDFISLENDNCSFSTLIKVKDKDSFVLRIYNSENHEIKNIEINSFDGSKLSVVNLKNSIIADWTEKQGNLATGELCSVMIEKGEEVNG